MIVPLLFVSIILTYVHGSASNLVKSFEMRYSFMLLFQFLEACFNPYRDFLSLYIPSSFAASLVPSGILTHMSSLMSAFRNAVSTSIAWTINHDWTDMARKMRIETNLATGLHVSV